MKHACEDISRLASEKLERRLNFLERLRLRLHFLMCSACRHYDTHITVLHNILKNKQKNSLEAARLPDKKREEIKEALKQTSAD